MFLLLLGKTFCFGYIHWTQQHDRKLVELSGKDNTVQKPQNIKPCSLVAMHIEKYYLEKNVCNQTFKIWKTLIYSNQSNPKPYKKTINQVQVQARLSCHHTTCMQACWQAQA